MIMGHRELLRYRFALIDQVMIKEWPKGLKTIPLVPSKLNEAKSMMPLLVPLDSLSDEIVAECLAVMDTSAKQPALFSLLLESDASTERMRTHLTAALLPPAVSTHFYFRFFDQRVMALLPEILTPESMASLLGPIRACAFFLDGGWNRLERRESRRARSLHLSQQEFIRLEQLQLINQALATYVPADYPNRIRTARQIGAFITQANTAGVTRQQDVLLFIEHAMTWHHEFHRHSHISALLASMDQSDDFPYSSVMSDLDDDQWRRISKELTMQGASAS